jgi:hypothetical protein
MNSLVGRATTVAGVACAIIGAGPVALAGAATPTPLPGMSCSVNQGLLPGIPNLGPTGPLGPLGAYGPSGNNNNLPCGASAFDLGPGGPLGPGGALGQPPAPPASPAPQAGPAPQARPAPQSTPAKRTSPARHPGHKRKHKHHGARHTRTRAHSKHAAR